MAEPTDGLEREERTERVRVVVADGDPLSRTVIRDVLQRAEGVVLVATAGDGVEAVELTKHYRPDVLLTEYRLARLDGCEVTRRVVADVPDIKVILFTVEVNEDLAVAVLRAGAAGVLSKEVPVESVVRALTGVTRGEAAISRSLTMRLVERVRRFPDRLSGMRPVKSPLTPREWEVLDLVSSGATTQQIAETLVLTEDTVYSHIKNIMRKLGVHTRMECIALAERMRRPDIVAQSPALRDPD